MKIEEIFKHKAGNENISVLTGEILAEFLLHLHGTIVEFFGLFFGRSFYHFPVIQNKFSRKWQNNFATQLDSPPSFHLHYGFD